MPWHCSTGYFGALANFVIPKFVFKLQSLKVDKSDHSKMRDDSPTTGTPKWFPTHTHD